MLILLSVVGVIGAAFAHFGNREVAKPGVGTRPGDIGSAADILSVARSKGHSLAAFGAG